MRLTRALDVSRASQAAIESGAVGDVSDPVQQPLVAAAGLLPQLQKLDEAITWAVGEGLLNLRQPLTVTPKVERLVMSAAWELHVLRLSQTLAAPARRAG